MLQFNLSWGHLLSTLILYFTFTSCTKEIDYPLLDYEDKPILNCVIVGDQTIYASAKWSSTPLNNPKYAAVTLKLFENDVLIKEVYNVSGQFYLDTRPKISAQYRISLLPDGMKDSVWTNDVRLPGVVKIDDITLLDSFYYVPDTKLKYPYFRVSFFDNYSESNFYEITTIFMYYLSNSDGKRTKVYSTSMFNTSDSILTKGEDLNYQNRTVLINDNEFFSERVNITLASRNSVWAGSNEFVSDTTMQYVILRHVSPEYYAYKKGILRNGVANDHGFFTGPTSPPYPLYSNVNNGYGILGAYSEYIDSMIIIWR